MEPIVTLKNVSFAYPDEEDLVFSDLNLDLPQGMTSVMGQNGTGKSTMLLLAGGRLFPQSGVIEILGVDSREIANEEDRNRLVSFIYQNMEFDTDDPVRGLMEFIYENGFHEKASEGLVDELTEVFELSNVESSPLASLSKGEMQRTIIAFSLLYGSKVIMMDEPIFALEDHQKDKTMEYMVAFAEKYDVHVLYSVHELALSEKYSKNIILFHEDGGIITGTTEEILTDEAIEKAYGLPRTMLYQKEHLYRDSLLRLSEIRPDVGDN